MQKQQKNILQGIIAAECSIKHASFIFDSNYHKTLYWRNKVLSADIKQHRGKRWSKFSPNEYVILERHIFDYVVQEHYLVTRQGVVTYLNSKGFQVSSSFITRIFKRFVFSFF